ncbi:hypothetical protein LX36DRAFT_41837 [Colletotrichum falcatum]|nr:hypothetical protein LX36DRAFT_41837 [Colletotrichum falcatum]
MNNRRGLAVCCLPVYPHFSRWVGPSTEASVRPASCNVEVAAGRAVTWWRDIMKEMQRVMAITCTWQVNVPARDASCGCGPGRWVVRSAPLQEGGPTSCLGCGDEFGGRGERSLVRLSPGRWFSVPRPRLMMTRVPPSQVSQLEMVGLRVRNLGPVFSKDHTLARKET